MAFPPANGWRQPRADGLAQRIPSWNTLYRILTRKIATIPASRLHPASTAGRVSRTE